MGAEHDVGSAQFLGVSVDRPTTLWILAILSYGVGDTATTLIGLRMQGIAEVGPVALFAMELAGDMGFLILKCSFLIACFATWWRLETRARIAIPMALIVAGTAVTGWNVVMLLL